MIGLKLRTEFLTDHMAGTAISLRTNDNEGAVQKSAEEFLSITYPTADVLQALKALSEKRGGRPIVLLGERGRGKSHILAVMHHAVKSPEAVEKWLQYWSKELGNNEIESLELSRGFFAISEAVHNHEYGLLWNLLFDKHPRGEYYRGKFENMDQPFPPRSLLEKMFEDQPTCILLDEFQTWYTGLPEKDPKSGLLLKQYAYNFVQNLSEIASDRKDILIFGVSVMNNQNEAFQQVHRKGPVVIDFRGPSAKEDRQKLLLHRLFENRRNISVASIDGQAKVYAEERFRLLYSNKSDAERNRILQEVSDCWPFSPELLSLLEDHILLSSVAQETRDLIRMLAQVFRSRGDVVPLITACDFLVDSDSLEVQTLIDSIAVQVGQEKLRQIALRNLEALRDCETDTPHARELISAVWMRSLSPGKMIGGTAAELQLDITRFEAIDDNAFQAELAVLIENSVNIHGGETPGSTYWLGVAENPRSKVRACAKNNKLWHAGASGGMVYPSKDVLHIRNTLRHVLVPEINQGLSRVIVLGPQWKENPWVEVEEGEKPSRWDKPVLLVIPEQIETGQVNQILGNWLAKHVQTRRNTIRFLLPASDLLGLFEDGELVFCARCSFLCSKDGGWGSDQTYRSLQQEFDRPLRQSLRSRFNRFAVLRKWDFQQPSKCIFEVEKIVEQGPDIAAAVERKVVSDLFDQTEFRAWIVERAKDGDSIGSVMDDLIEPPPPKEGDAIPFLGETAVYELILEFAAEGIVVLNVNGSWVGRRAEDSTIEDARRYVKSRAFRSGQEMRHVLLSLPGAVGGGSVTSRAPITSSGTSSTREDNNKHNRVDYSESGINETTEESDFSSVATETHLAQKQARVSQNKRSTGEATGINLSGCFEDWGISSEQALEKASIEFKGLTVQQLKQILQRIPSNYKAMLEVDYLEGVSEE